MIETAFRLEQVKNVPDHETGGGELGASWSMKTVASKKAKTQWEKWFETIKEEEKLQSNKNVAVQCIDFCEVTTSDVYAVLRHAPPDLRGGTLLQHPVFWWPLWHIKKTHISAYRSSMQPGSIPGLLEEIRRQSSVLILSGPAIVITNVATASAFLAKGWSTEFVSRVVRTAQDGQEDETEQSLSESLQTRRQISKIHENM